jgi:predicted ABC-type ATPase
MGGHGIPEKDIRRRFNISLNNLKKAIALCNDVLVYDNTERFKLIATFRNGQLIKRDDTGIEWFNKLFTF